jgi:4-oxalocrotonate tautomerase
MRDDNVAAARNAYAVAERKDLEGWINPEQQKKKLASEIIKAVIATLDDGEESVSVAMEEVKAADWTKKVYKPDILAKRDTLYKEPGVLTLTRRHRAFHR